MKTPFSPVLPNRSKFSVFLHRVAFFGRTESDSRTKEAKGPLNQIEKVFSLFTLGQTSETAPNLSDRVRNRSDFVRNTRSDINQANDGFLIRSDTVGQNTPKTGVCPKLKTTKNGTSIPSNAVCPTCPTCPTCFCMLLGLSLPAQKRPFWPISEMCNHHYPTNPE